MRIPASRGRIQPTRTLATPEFEGKTSNGRRDLADTFGDVEGRREASATNPRSSAPGPNPLPDWLPPVIYGFVAVAAVALLVANTFSCGDCWNVDTTSLGLLAILLLLPLAPYITSLRAGEYEAKIGQTDAQRLQESASDLPLARPETREGAPTVMELIERDPRLGLAKLRIDLEQEVRRIYAASVPGAAKRGLSLGMMIRELLREDVLPPDVAGPLQEVNDIGNRAVHGEYIQTEIAEEVANVGLRVLTALRDLDPAERR